MAERGDLVRKLDFLAADLAEDVVHHTRLGAGRFNARNGRLGMTERRDIRKNQLICVYLRLNDSYFGIFGIDNRFLAEGHSCRIFRLARIQAVRFNDNCRRDRHFRMLLIAASATNEVHSTGRTIFIPDKFRIRVIMSKRLFHQHFFRD